MAEIGRGEGTLNGGGRRTKGTRGKGLASLSGWGSEWCSRTETRKRRDREGAHSVQSSRLSPLHVEGL